MNLVVSIFVTFIAYFLALQLYKKSRLSILNPVLVAIIIIIAGLLILKINYEDYNVNTSVITYMLNPIVVFLAVPIYKSKDKIKGNIVPIIIGIMSGIATSILSIYVLGKLFKLDEKIVQSLYSKSITTPLAVEVTRMFNGVEGLTVVGVILTGIIGAALAPVVMKVGKIKSEIAMGIGIGTASHGVGTAKAVEMGTEAGGASGLAMAITGVITVLIASFIIIL